MVQKFFPFQGGKFSHFTVWTSEVDDIIAYVNVEIQVIWGEKLLPEGVFTIWTYYRRKRHRGVELVIWRRCTQAMAHLAGVSSGTPG